MAASTSRTDLNILSEVDSDPSGLTIDDPCRSRRHTFPLRLQLSPTPTHILKLRCGC